MHCCCYLLRHIIAHKICESMMNVGDGAKKEPIHFLVGIEEESKADEKREGKKITRKTVEQVCQEFGCISLWLFPYDKCLLVYYTFT